MALNSTRACHQRGVLFWSKWIHINWMGIKLYKTCFFSTPRKFNNSPLKIGQNVPKGKDGLPTIMFQGLLLQNISGVYSPQVVSHHGLFFQASSRFTQLPPLEALGPYLPVINEDEVPEDWRRDWSESFCFFFQHPFSLLLMEEILHQLIGSLCHYLQGFLNPRWCRISSINSSAPVIRYEQKGTRLTHLAEGSSEA